MVARKTVWAAFILINAWSLAEAQSGVARIGLSVPKATFLALASPSAEVQQVSGKPSEGHLQIHVKRPVTGEHVRVSLLVRSNTAYRLTARVRANTDSGYQLTLRPEGAEPYSGTDQIMPDALNIRFEQASTVSAIVDTPILEGSRISKRGNQTTRSNAVVLTFYVEMPKDLNDADLILQMDPRP